MKRRTFLKNMTGLSAGILASGSGFAESATASKRYDAIIFGATPAGIVAANRMAREGHKVLLVSVFKHIGGMLTNGLSMMDTLYEGQRAPLYAELLTKLHTYYADRDGPNSENARFARFGSSEDSGARPRFEAKVMLKLLNEWVGNEKNITLLRQYDVSSVERQGRLIKSVQFRSFKNQPMMTATSQVYMDCSYEGDLMAQAGVKYVIGREARREFDEKHAGKIFVKQESGDYPRAAALKLLNLRTIGVNLEQLQAGSTGEGDKAVQAYNMRFVLSTDPANHRHIEKPAGYERARYLNLTAQQDVKTLTVKGIKLMNGKFNDPGFGDYPEHNWTYPTANWSERQRIAKEHVDYGLGLLYFLQNDDSMPAEIRRKSAPYGLSLDEFADNENVPYEVYVREARRMRGRYVFTENDAVLAAGINRTPIHADSIAVAEWLLDSHDCTTDRRGSLHDGFLLLSETTRPAQIPYRMLLPNEIDNLLVVGCPSVTHIGWGTIRVEPTIMHLAESAAWAAVLAISTNTPVSEIAVPKLQKLLVEHGIMLSFFNEFDMATRQPWVTAIQYFGTKGFFVDYDAQPDRVLTHSEAIIWIESAQLIRENKTEAMKTARQLQQQAGSNSTKLITVAEFIKKVQPLIIGKVSAAQIAQDLSLNPEAPIRRQESCQLLYRIINSSRQ